MESFRGLTYWWRIPPALRDVSNPEELFLRIGLHLASASEGEILFVNEAFRKQFGERQAESLIFGQPGSKRTDGQTLSSLAATRAISAEQHEPSFSQFLDDASGKWFDVRAREIRWVDGRLANMLVAVDVSVRHELEEKQRLQEKIDRDPHNSRHLLLSSIQTNDPRKASVQLLLR